MDNRDMTADICRISRYCSIIDDHFTILHRSFVSLGMGQAACLPVPKLLLHMPLHLPAESVQMGLEDTLPHGNGRTRMDMYCTIPPFLHRGTPNPMIRENLTEVPGSGARGHPEICRYRVHAWMLRLHEPVPPLQNSPPLDPVQLHASGLSLSIPPSRKARCARPRDLGRILASAVSTDWARPSSPSAAAPTTATDNAVDLDRPLPISHRHRVWRSPRRFRIEDRFTSNFPFGLPTSTFVAVLAREVPSFGFRRTIRLVASLLSVSVHVTLHVWGEVGQPLKSLGKGTHVRERGGNTTLRLKYFDGILLNTSTRCPLTR